MFHFIFDYNYGNFWQIFIIFPPQETGMNTLPNMYKPQPNYVSTLPGKTKNHSWPLTAVHSVELIVPDFCRKSFSVRFFPICYKIL